MASNSLPQRLEKLFLLGADMADGLHTLETAVGVKQNTEAAVRADLDAARDAQAVYQANDAGESQPSEAVEAWLREGGGGSPGWPATSGRWRAGRRRVARGSPGARRSPATGDDTSVASLCRDYSERRLNG